MLRYLWVLVCLIATVVLMSLFDGSAVFSHSGRTDSSGGHNNRKTGEYHYHNSGRARSAGTSESTTPVKKEIVEEKDETESVSIDEQVVTELMPYPAEDFTEAPAYKVLKISATKITIEKDGQTMNVRLLGLHTSWLLSDRGSTFLRDLLMGESVYLLNAQKTKGWVNTLDAYVYRAPDGLFVNLELIRLGYAQAGNPAGTRQAFLKHYGARAKSAGKGFWDKPKEIKVKTLWD